MNLSFEYSILNFFESIRTPFLNSLFIGITQLGSFDFYITVIPILFFIINEKIAYRFLFRLIICYGLNTILKNTFKLPRPSKELIDVLFEESGGGYGFPSGHAQNATVFWLSFYTEFKRWIFLIIGLIMIFLISISRLYLGVHFFMDVVGGIFIGIVFLFLYIYLLQKPLDKVSVGNIKINLPISIILFILSFFNLFSMATLFAATSGMILGIGISSNLNYQMKNGILKTIIRVVIGVGILILLRFGLKIIIGETLYMDIIRYFIMGIWITFFSKILFKFLKI